MSKEASKKVEVTLVQNETRWYYRARSDFSGVIVQGYAPDVTLAMVYVEWGLRHAGYNHAADQMNGNGE